MFQRWIDDLTSRPGTVAVLFGVMALLLGIYIWSATEVRRSHERRMQRIRDTLYISTALLGQLTIQENRNYERSEHEHNDLITAMLACKAASYLSPQLQDQIRDCIKEHDPAKLGLMHRALERECTVLSDELSRDTQAIHWGTAIWTILRPIAEPAAVAATGFLVTDLVFRQRMLDVPVDSWDNILPWMRAISLMITIIYGYLLWASLQRDRPGTVTKLLSLLIALCSLLHLIGPVAAPYALGLQLILFTSGFSLTGTRYRSDRPYAGHTDLEPTKQVSTELEENTRRTSGTNTDE
ncbi:MULTISPECIES: hypothetical protein [unclassified Paenibacillus]|uniref:hypothetical protein n=1 Tax=unclassified Paenibacillus TaxID=185978 RepID=UPI000CFD3E69|nr:MULTISPECIES: hypothetical protein [unclassified Paenibacillus]PRA01674.1 hypothetical protein CQ043_24870 [Paenibacillus sp. MYb63]PRA44368.1 hypothetical protein CQ061_25210 [Paenibacillus sp. MYb67]QZN77579.1 hypothetical protein K5K90_10555 [Paenibacillus sp. DR312]